MSENSSFEKELAISLNKIKLLTANHLKLIILKGILQLNFGLPENSPFLKASFVSSRSNRNTIGLDPIQNVTTGPYLSFKSSHDNTVCFLVPRNASRTRRVS
jgi:hypothetical protein